MRRLRLVVLLVLTMFVSSGCVGIIATALIIKERKKRAALLAEKQLTETPERTTTQEVTDEGKAVEQEIQ